MKSITTTSLIALIVTLVLSAATASAQPAGGDQRFRASIYGFIPDLGGSTAFPAGGRTIEVDAETLIDHTDKALMGSFEARFGRVAAFADAVHFDIGNTVANGTSFEISGLSLPPGVTANASLDVKATAVTFGAGVRLVSSPIFVLEAFGGARLLDVRGDLGWEFNTDFGPFAGPARAGASEASSNFWDGVGGVKGRLNLMKSGRLFIPYYGDAGAGQSDFTRQAMAGVGYAFKYAEIVTGWRHLDYEFEPGKTLETLDFSGPTIGVSFRW